MYFSDLMIMKQRNSLLNIIRRFPLLGDYKINVLVLPSIEGIYELLQGDDVDSTNGNIGLKTVSPYLWKKQRKSMEII